MNTQVVPQGMPQRPLQLPSAAQLPGYNRGADQHLCRAVSANSFDDLPFEQLSRMLKEASISDRHTLDQPMSPASQELYRAVMAKFEDTVLPHLRALLPAKTIWRMSPERSVDISACQRFSLAQIDLLTYSASNNCAGLNRPADLKLVYEYLTEPLYGLVTKTSSVLNHGATLATILAAKPMIETLFRGAIDAGDDRTICNLLSVRELGIDVNSPTCTGFGGEQRTPVEKSAELHHLSLVKLLIAFGASVNRVVRSDWDKMRTECPTLFPRGALEYALTPRRDCTAVACRASSCVSLTLIELLLKAGGTFAGEFLLDILGDKESARLSKVLIQERLESCYESWLELGIFHMAMKQLDSEANAVILHQLWEAKGKLPFESKLEDLRYDSRHRYPYRDWDPTPDLAKQPIPPHLIDIAAERGDISVVQSLRAYGAEFTGDTLTAAIRSRNKFLINALLESRAPADTFSQHFKSTPYAEAIKLGDIDTIQALVDLGCKANLQDACQLCAALAAVAEAGDQLTLQNMLSDHFSRTLHPAWVGGYALARAVQSNNTIVAIVLLEAGASTFDGDIMSAFEVRFEDQRGREDEHLSGPNKGLFLAMNPLFTALKNHNAELVRALLDYGALLDKDVFSASRDSGIYVEAAVSWGDPHIVEELVTMLKNFGCSLSIAVRKHDRVTAAYLLERGADPDGITYSADHIYAPDTCQRRCRRGQYASPLLEAVYNKDLPMVHLLLEAGANPARGHALRQVVADNDLLAINLLLEAGADPTKGNTLSQAVTSSPLSFEILINAMSKIHPNRRRCSIDTALITAISFGAIVQVRRLLELQASPHAFVAGLYGLIPSDRRGEYGDFVWGGASPLAVAIAKDGGRDLETVALLLDRNPELISSVEPYSHTISGLACPPEPALLLAIGLKASKMVQLLLRRGAEVNFSAQRGIQRTPLQKAAEIGSYDIVQLLLSHGADVNGSPAARAGATALQLAAAGGYIGLAELLLDAGADLLASGAKVDGRTALEGAAENGRFDMVKYLTSRGPHPYEQLESAQQLAAENGHNAVVEMIRSIQLEFRARPIGSGRSTSFDCSAYSCDQCGQELCNASALRRHERAKHGSATDRGKFTCEICGRNFSRKDTLDRHREREAKRKCGQQPDVDLAMVIS